MLTRQLLAFSRRQYLQPKVIDLNHIVTDTQLMLNRLIGEHIVQQTALNAEVGWVRVDPGQIEQILFNLAINARDTMPHGRQLVVETTNIELGEADGDIPPGT
jgi:two-component system cell cycle sensor histidine kinase/response regulator CckA